MVHVTEGNLGKLPSFVSLVCERERDPSTALEPYHMTFAFRKNSIIHIRKSHNQGLSQVILERKGSL